MPITLGNLTIAEGEQAVELRLNTYHKGRPVALFSYEEIPALISLLREVRRPGAVQEDNGDDWKDLI